MVNALSTASAFGKIVDKGGHQPLDLLARSIVARPPALGQVAHLLFQRKHVAAFLLDDCLTEQVAQHVDIRAQLLLLFQIHPRILVPA